MAKEFYKHARAYDIAFKDRDFDIECDFLEWCLKTYGKINNTEIREKSFLELACGPARHAREFAKRGWKATALDLSAEMVSFAASEAERENLRIDTIVADMSDFRCSRKYSLAATLMESIAHLTTNEQMISHFKSVAEALEPGGIYVIEATHPLFFFPDDEINSWVCEEGGTKVELTFGQPGDKYDSISQTWDVTTRLKIWEGANNPLIEEHISTVRWYLSQEMKMLIEISGVFEDYWIYGSTYYIPPKDIDDSEDSDSMVIVLRTKR
ncbi:MAG: class I SAM-dependent methyltransferase [Melioribacteraceae bacterium]|nr:class I SAM-dependent methyltransferase [Melioribacteraceae bacterium]